MAGYIGSKASVVSSGAERKKVFDITTTTTSLTGLNYTPNQVHVFHNGVRLVDGTDYTATTGASITLTSAAESGDQVVVVSYAAYQVSDTVSASVGGTFSGDVSVTGSFTSTGIDDNATSTAITINGSQNVGIGTTSPNKMLHLKANTPVINLHSDNASSAQISFTNSGGVSEQGFIKYEHAGDFAGSMQFRTSGSERMRIDSSGTVLVGKTGDNAATSGSIFNGNGDTYLTAEGSRGRVLYLNRLTSDGSIIDLRKDGTSVGSMGVDNTYITLGKGDTGLKFHDAVDSIIPHNLSTNAGRDNAIDLGFSAFRFDDIYATNGTIQTSDRNEKQDIDVLSDAEQRVAVACKGLLRKFRWKDAVAEKGDDARIHFGIIAQDLQDAFAAEGLDAGRYAMFISSTWWETQTEVPAVEAVEAVEAVYEDVVIPAVEEELDEEGNVIAEAQPERTEQHLVAEAVEAVEAKEAYTRTDTYETLEEAPEGATERTRLGVRYPELLAFIIGAM